MIFDTDVLVWVSRGNLRAARLVDSSENRQLSVVSYMELVEGALDQRDLETTREMLLQYGFVVLPLTEGIGHRAAIYMDHYHLKHGLGLADALIAAAAAENMLVLCTANVKHFRVIPGLSVKPFRP